MKSSLFIVGTMLLILPQTFLFAEETRGTNPPPPQYGSTPPPAKSTDTKNTDTKNTDAKYWEDQKAQAQVKSTEMRKAKYTELLGRWADVSILTADLLDATKTDEWKFWDAVRIIQQAGEIKARKEYLTKISSQGIDISGFTDAIIADGNAFWELAKKLQKQNPVVSDRPTTTPLVDTGSPEKSRAHELETRQKIIAELKAHGIDTSGFTSEIIWDGEAFWKLVQSLKWSYEKNQWIKRETKDTVKQESKDTKKDAVRETSPIKSTQGLSPKAREMFQTRLDSIPAEKKVAMLTRLEELLQKQIEVAKTKWTKRLIAKLQEMLDIVHEEQGSADDISLVNTLLSGN